MIADCREKRAGQLDLLEQFTAIRALARCSPTETCDTVQCDVRSLVDEAVRALCMVLLPGVIQTNLAVRSGRVQDCRHTKAKCLGPYRRQNRPQRVF